MFNVKECGSRIKELRNKKGLTQEELAEALHISDSHLRKTENGQRSASIELYVEITRYFHVSLDYLFLGKNHPAGQMKAEINEVITRLQQISSQL